MNDINVRAEQITVEFVDQLAAALFTAQERIRVLEEALKQCAEWFTEYSDGHLAKGDIEKSARNFNRASVALFALNHTDEPLSGQAILDEVFPSPANKGVRLGVDNDNA